MVMDAVEIINGYGWSSEHQWLWIELRISVVMDRVENINGYGWS